MIADLRFFLLGKEYAARQWFYVPRVNDEVILGPDTDRVAYIVKRVVWGNENLNFKPHEGQRQRVNIEIEVIL